MGLTVVEGGAALEPPRRRSRASGNILKLETDIAQLYMRMMDEPIPGRLLEVLRTALTVPKP